MIRTVEEGLMQHLVSEDSEIIYTRQPDIHLSIDTARIVNIQDAPVPTENTQREIAALRIQAWMRRVFRRRVDEMGT